MPFEDPSTKKSPYELVLERLKRDSPVPFKPDRPRITADGLLYLGEVLSEQGYQKNDRMKFYNVFQQYMMYQFAAIILGELTPEGEPDIIAAAKRKNEVDAIIHSWTSAPNINVEAPGVLFRKLFEDVVFLTHLADHDLEGANRYALDAFYEAYPHILKARHAT